MVARIAFTTQEVGALLDAVGFQPEELEEIEEHNPTLAAALGKLMSADLTLLALDEAEEEE